MNIRPNQGLRFQSPPSQSTAVSAAFSPKDTLTSAVVSDPDRGRWKRVALGAAALVATGLGAQSASASEMAIEMPLEQSASSLFQTTDNSHGSDTTSQRLAHRDDRDRQANRVIHHNDGTVEHRSSRNHSIDSNGVSRHRVGDTYIRSDGHVEHQVGDYRVGPDGEMTYNPQN